MGWTWRTRFGAAAVAIATGVSGLAVVALVPATPAEAQDGINFEAPTFPQANVMMLNVQGFRSWLTFDTSSATPGGFGRIYLDNETDIGTQFNEYGVAKDANGNPIGADDLRPDERHVGRNELGGSEFRQMGENPLLVATGDLDGNGSAEVVSLDDNMDLYLSANVDHGVRDSSSTSPGRQSRMANIVSDLSGRGVPVAVGILDGMSPGKNRVFVVTEDGQILLYAPSGNFSFSLAASRQLPSFANEKVLDAAAHSVLDGETRDLTPHQSKLQPGSVTERPGYIALGTVSRTTGATLSIYEANVDPATAQFTSGPGGFPDPARLIYQGTAGSGTWQDARIKTDVTTDASDPAKVMVGYGLLATSDLGDGVQGLLMTAVGEDGETPSRNTEESFCNSTEPGRSPELGFMLIPGSPADGPSGGTDGGLVAACAGLTSQAGQVQVNHLVEPFGSSASRRTVQFAHPTGLADNTDLHVGEVAVDTPCEWLLLKPPVDPQNHDRFEGDCSSGHVTTDPLVTGQLLEYSHSRKNTGRISTYVHLDKAGANKTLVVSRDPFQQSAGTVLPNSWSYIVNSSPGNVVVPLPPQMNFVRVRLDNPGAPKLQELDPLPLVVMQSPPYVNGLGQVPLAGPTYNVRTTTGSSHGNHTENEVGITLGVDFEDPTGLMGAEASTTLQSAAGSEFEESLTVTSNEQFVGDPYEDTIVYSARTVWRFTGEVIESELGLGLNTPIVIDVPRSTVITSATLSSLQHRFAGSGLFDPGPQGSNGAKGELTRVLTHTAGDPGSYTRWGSGGTTSPSVSQYCDNSAFDESQPVPDELPSYPWGVDDNPFTSPDIEIRDLEGPGILNSDMHSVQVGQGNSEGAGFSITNSKSYSRISSMSWGAAAGATVAYVTVGYSAEHTWGESWTNEFEDGVDFLGYVGHLPTTNLSNETYDYRLFLCKKQLGKDAAHPVGYPVWVFGYTVDDYLAPTGTAPENLKNYGSGGLEDLGEVELDPVVPPTVARASTTPTLSWQTEGTAERFDVEVEAVGGLADAQSKEGFAQITNTVEAKGRGATTSASLADLGFHALRTNQLYRWRVTAHDFIGNESPSEWEFFTTAGPLQNVTITNPVTFGSGGAGTTPVDVLQAGKFYQWQVQHEDMGAPFEYRWETGDGRVFDIHGGSCVNECTTSTLRTTYPNAGVYQLKARVKNAYDPNGAWATQTVIVGPQANSETYSTDEDTALTKDAAHGVLANDTGGELAKVVIGPEHAASFTLNLDGSFSYTPNDDYCSTASGVNQPKPSDHDDEFTYSVRGGPTIINAKAFIKVVCKNDVPVLNPITTPYEVTEDNQLAESAPGVLRTVSDVDYGEEHKVVIPIPDADLPQNGTLLQLGEDGSFVYEPDFDFCGTDSFKVRAKDKAGTTSNKLTVPITVSCVNDPPTASDRGFTVGEDSGFTTLPAPGLLGGSSDPDTPYGDVLLPTVVGGPSHGLLGAVNADGSFQYRPVDDFCGTDTFTFRLRDSGRPPATPAPAQPLFSNLATATVTVTCANDAPTVVSSQQTVDEDTLLDIGPAGVLTGSHDPDTVYGDTLAAVQVTGPSNGTLTLDADGSYEYKGNANYCGPDSFTFKARDGGRPPAAPAPAAPLDSNVGTVSITVTCVNDKPVANPDTGAAIDGQPVSIPAPGLLANDTDVEDGKPTVVPGTITTSGGGTLVVNADGSATYTAKAGFHGVDTATYTVKDSANETSTGQVTVNVKARTTLTATRAVHSGGRATVSGKLTLTGNGVAVAGQTIKFVLSSGALFCTATTGANGVASCAATVPPAFRLGGRYNAVYDGNSEHLPAISPSTAFGTLAPN